MHRKIKWKQQVKRNGFTSPVGAVLAIFGPKAGKTETPNNGICIIIADHQGGEAPRGPAVLARVGPQIPTKHHNFVQPPPPTH